MKENGSVMAENPPPPFKLEREVTLMPSEFRERLSASHRSRKSSAARSANTRKKAMRSTKPQMHNTVNISHLNAFSEELDNGMDLAYHTAQTQYQSLSDYSSQCDGDKHEDDQTVATAIELNEEVKFMLDNAYSNYEAENSYTIKTPPSNMQIRDLMVPLEDWGSRETIRERKYTVLPSIKSPNSEKSHPTTRLSNFSELSLNNQLDFGRDKMEQEADFFADFRVNTSKVRPTPRQDPLPPIQHAPSSTPEFSPPYLEHQRHSSTMSKQRGRSKERSKMLL